MTETIKIVQQQDTQIKIGVATAFAMISTKFWTDDHKEATVVFDMESGLRLLEAFDGYMEIKDSISRLARPQRKTFKDGFWSGFRVWPAVLLGFVVGSMLFGLVLR